MKLLYKAVIDARRLTDHYKPRQPCNIHPIRPDLLSPRDWFDIGSRPPCLHAGGNLDGFDDFGKYIRWGYLYTPPGSNNGKSSKRPGTWRL